MTRVRLVAILSGAIALSACAENGTTSRTHYKPAPFVPIPTAGLDRVIGQSGGALVGLFGQPLADVREGSVRKLQFGNATCVLDAYLYPKNNGEPLVTYVDARQTDGSPIDRASCVGALQAGRRR